MHTLRSANIALRFAIELCALGFVSFWGFHVVSGAGAGLALGVGAPLLFAVAWGLLAAPKAPAPLPRSMKVGVQVSLLLVPSAALLQLGRPLLAGAFAALVVANAALLQAGEL